MITKNNLTSQRSTLRELRELLIFCVVEAYNTVDVAIAVTNDITCNPFLPSRMDIQFKLKKHGVHRVEEKSNIIEGIKKLTFKDLQCLTCWELCDKIHGIGVKTATHYVLCRNKKDTLRCVYPDKHIVDCVNEGEEGSRYPYKPKGMTQHRVIYEFCEIAERKGKTPLELDCELYDGQERLIDLILKSKTENSWLFKYVQSWCDYIKSSLIHRCNR